MTNLVGGRLVGDVGLNDHASGPTTAAESSEAATARPNRLGAFVSGLLTPLVL